MAQNMKKNSNLMPAIHLLRDAYTFTMKPCRANFTLYHGRAIIGFVANAKIRHNTRFG